MSVAVKVENVSKKYLIQTSKSSDTWVNTLADLSWLNVRREEFWALKDVSFELMKGEVLGIIGKNGSGKSTLLKILSRITPPSKGKAEICGSVSSLLEVGTGFNAELTGRENIFLNGAILGMTKKEIRRKFSEIVEFSGVERFIDTPVKRYSSGMYVRLAFSVAAHLEPEILIVDEVLSVGDLEFQQKCLGKMKNAARSGRTVLFVSHNLSAVRTLCDKALVLNQGQASKISEVEKAIKQYLQYLGVEKNRTAEKKFNNDPNKLIQLSSIQVRQPGGKVVRSSLGEHDGVEVRLRYLVKNKINTATSLSLSIENQDGNVLVYSQDVGRDFRSGKSTRNKGDYEAVIILQPWLLAQGSYFISVKIFQTGMFGQEIDIQERCCRFKVEDKLNQIYNRVPALTAINPKWSIKRLD